MWSTLYYFLEKSYKRLVKTKIKPKNIYKSETNQLNWIKHLFETIKWHIENTTLICILYVYFVLAVLKLLIECQRTLLDMTFYFCLLMIEKRSSILVFLRTNFRKGSQNVPPPINKDSVTANKDIIILQNCYHKQYDKKSTSFVSLCNHVRPINPWNNFL